MDKRPTGTYAQLADLPLSVEACELETLARDVSSAFRRVTTVVRLRGGGNEGLGEDVTYDAADHEPFRAHAAGLRFDGNYTLASFCDRIDELDLFATEPAQQASRRYRVWAFSSAALDLALRQAGLSLADALQRELQPLRFVVSLRLGEPATIEPVRQLLAFYPGLRFKLDPTSSWTDEVIADLVATGAVDSVDFKSFYAGTIVDQKPDPALYARVIEAFPEVWIEDPALTPETEAVLHDHRDRITWDAPIHSISDIEALPFPPKSINVKPSRFGNPRRLFATYDWLRARGIAAYGGGQFELSVGRGQIQYLAALFHPDGPNDVAPGGYNLPEPGPGLAESPLVLRPHTTGFRAENRDA